MDTTNKTKIVKTKKRLKNKVGAGGFRDEDLKRAQSKIDHNDVNFSPIAEKLLNDLNAVITKVKKQKLYSEETIGALMFPVLQLKAQGAMFNAPVYTDISTDLLFFLEDVKQIDNNVLEILSSFHKAVKVIHQLKIKDSSHNVTKQLNAELKLVYARYLSQQLTA